jgi:hypothetical protein
VAAKPIVLTLIIEVLKTDKSSGESLTEKDPDEDLRVEK